MRPGQAVAASETPGTDLFGRGSCAGTKPLREEPAQGRGLRGERSQGRHIPGRDGTGTPGTSRGRMPSWGIRGRPTEAFVACGRIGVQATNAPRSVPPTVPSPSRRGDVPVFSLTARCRSRHLPHESPADLPRSPLLARTLRRLLESRPFRRRPQPARVASEMAASPRRPATTAGTLSPLPRSSLSEPGPNPRRRWRRRIRRLPSAAVRSGSPGACGRERCCRRLPSGR